MPDYKRNIRRIVEVQKKMSSCILVKVGEVHLKGLNRPYFEKKLAEHIRAAVRPFGGKVNSAQSRIYVHNISDEDMLGGITELLNEVIADPESIQIPNSDHEENQEIKRLNAEISKALNTVSFDKEAIKQKMLTCVSEKYTSLGTEEITAQSLKDIFKTVPPLTAYDSDLTDHAVSEIQLKRNGTISLVLINGQRIGKEKSA